MATIYEFPTGKILKDDELSEEEIVNQISTACAEIAEHLFEIIDEEVVTMSEEGLMVLNGINLRNSKKKEYNDAAVIVNLLYALIMRHVGVNHALQDELDRLHKRIKKLHNEIKNNDTT